MKDTILADRAKQIENLRLELVSESQSEKAPEPPLRLVLRALRGRYRLAALLAALLATVGGTIGYLAVPVKYVSTGIVHIEGVIPAILYPTLENQVPPMFDAYIASQVASLGSWKLLAAAVDQPEMAEAGWPVGPRGVSALNDELNVARTRGENTIFVSVTNRSPHMAQTAVNSVLAAYRESDPQPAGLSLAAKEQVLVQHEEKLEAQLQPLRLRMLEYSDPYGHIPIKQIHADKAAEWMAIEKKLKQIQLARRNLEAGYPPGHIGMGLTPTHAGIDSNLSPLQEQELALIAEIKSAQTRYRSKHPIFRVLVRQLEVVRTQLELRRRVQSTPTTQYAESEFSIPILDQVDRLEVSYTEMRDRLLKEAAALGLRRIFMARLEEKVAALKERLSATRRRLDEIRFEAHRENTDRISIVDGGLPWLPSSDRRAGLTGAGIMFGTACGVALVVLIGVRDRRIRFVNELEAMNLPVPIVGLIPELVSSTPVPAISELRHLLQLQCSASERNVYTLTSCDQSEGRTKVAFVLAVSFANAGHKTLLIDAAFGSSLLSRKLDIANRPGLREAIGAGSCSGQIHPTSHKNLLIMPIGTVLGVLQKDFTRQVVRRLYHVLRSRYDTIIVDTGPVRCEFEACLIAAEADQVVMIVDRNQGRDQVLAAVTRLGQLDIDTPGLIYNGATVSDVRFIDVSNFGTMTDDESFAGADSLSRAAADAADMKLAA